MSLAPRATLVLGRYRIVRQLGQGGMGVVYLGRLEGGAGFSKPVVIKRIRSDIGGLQDNTARFIREAHILSQLQHPSIVRVLDFGREGDGYAMVLEYMHGYDLACWLRYLQRTSTRVHWEEALLILLRALDGLHYAHTFRHSNGAQGGVLHRDISPGNILLDIDGQVRLLDFGIARPLEKDAAQYQTKDGVLSGKTGYLAPELFADVPSSVASDVYACGVVLYYLLGGVHPFLAQSESHTMWRVLQEPPRPLTALRDDLPAGLEPVVLRAIAKEPSERHASAQAFAGELRSLLVRHESELQRALAEHVRRDFTGPMPELLALEPLLQRERAWLVEQDESNPALPVLRSSRLPPEPLREAPTVVGTPAAAGARSRALSSPPGPAPARAAGWKHTHWLRRSLLGGGVLLLAGGLIVRRSSEPEPATAQFIVVQSPPPATQEAAVSDLPATGRAASANSADAPAAPAAMARQLTRRQAALQACFQSPSSAEPGLVEATLNFEVAASGSVMRASLEPVAMEASSLGQCLLRVARETSFQPLPRPLRFSVPLRARPVAK